MVYARLFWYTRGIRAVYARYTRGICVVYAWYTRGIQEPTELWKKKRFNLQAPPVYDRKVTNLFFSIIIFSIIIFFP